MTVRARLTLLYTGLFAACGAIVVAVSYWLVSRVEAQVLMTKILGELPSDEDLHRVEARLAESGWNLV